MRPLLGTAIVFALLAVVTWWTSARRKPEAPAPFFALQRARPDTLEVMCGRDRTVMVPSGDAGWEIISPVRYPADALIVHGLLTRLADLTVDAVFDLPREKLDTYGIRFPAAVVRVAYRGGLLPDTLVVGSPTPDEHYVYVRPGSQPRVGLVPATTVQSYLARETFDWRETRLLPFPESLARQVRLLGPSGVCRVELARGEEGAWRVVRPYGGPGSAKKIGEYLKSLNHMHIQTFVREGTGPLEPYGLVSPWAGVRVDLEGGQVLGFDLGDSLSGGGGFCATVRGRAEVVGVPRAYGPVLAREAGLFREPLVLTFGLEDVDSVQVVEEREARVIRVSPTGGDPEREILGAWLLLEARDFRPADAGELEACGLSSPHRRLVWWGGGDTLAVVDLGPAGETGVPVRVSGGARARPEEILLLPGERVEPLWRRLHDPSGPAEIEPEPAG